MAAEDECAQGNRFGVARPAPEPVASKDAMRSLHRLASAVQSLAFALLYSFCCDSCSGSR
jgi:hypothetical protein